MTLAAAMLAVTVAFPANGAKLPYVERCYMIGAVGRGVTNLTVQGRSVDIYRTGAWATMVDLEEGTNTVDIVAGETATNLTVFVASKPQFDPLAPRPPERKYEKLEYAADGPAPRTGAKGASETVVWLDPGHGGTDTGALSPHGFPEKDANLRVAREVRKALEEKGYAVFMTRDTDATLDLHERPRKAHEGKADAFVSIHHNAPGAASDPRKTRYSAVYAWNPLGEALAGAISQRMEETLEGDIPSKGVLHANFAVTRSPEIPSCLVEVDFLTTPHGEEDCWNHLRRRAIGRAIADGIEDYLRAEGIAL